MSSSIEALSTWAWVLGTVGLLANFGVIYGLYLERTERKGDVERPLRGRRGELWVIIGIIAEITFGLGASISANRVETRQRAEILALERQIAPRRLTADQSELIRLAAVSSVDLIGVSSYALDPESAVLCEQIFQSLAIRWPKPIDGCMSRVAFNRIDLGIQITGSDSGLRDAFAKTIRSFGLAVATEVPPESGASISGGSGQTAAKPDVSIFVGVKPLSK
jgi:hypothetical protein